MLVAEGTYSAEICERYGIGASVDIRDESSVSSFLGRLREFSKDKRPLIEMGKRALRLFNEVFSWEKIRKRYVSLVGEVLGA